MRPFRFLRVGERVPETEPHRNTEANGTVRLRWRVGSEWVATQQHRVRDGVVIDHWLERALSRYTVTALPCAGPSNASSVAAHGQAEYRAARRAA